MKRLTVCVVTGTRAEYGIWRPVLSALAEEKNLRLQLAVTGMHLLGDFGMTVGDIERDGWAIAARVPMYRKGESPAQGLARGVAGFDAAFAKLKPDVVMVLGDRLEMLAAAQAAMCQGRIIGHVHGGETAPGQFDEQIRHAVTKLAHLHFCATKRAGARIVQMGEAKASVHVVGAPALDMAVPFARHALRFIKQRQINIREIAGLLPTLVLHPSGGGEKMEYQRALLVVDRLRSMFHDIKIHVVGPNNDPGYRGILRAYRERREHLWLEMSKPQEFFWASILDGLLVGNSSSGIIEAASLGCAVINLGQRQAGRERSGNVIDVPWEAGAAGLQKALQKALSDRAFQRRIAARKNIYGDGRAAQRIVAILSRLDPHAIPRAKSFSDR